MPITTIPFSGFYNSLHDAMLDSAVEQVFTDDAGDINYDLLQRAQDVVRWQDVRMKYAARFVQEFAQEFKMPLVFESLKSPKEYNFETDIIYCNIAPEETAWLYDTCDKTLLAKIAQETLTSYDGFSSFYDPDFTTWGSVETWDHSQIGVLIRAHVTEQNPDFDRWAEYDLMVDCSGDGAIENWIFGSSPKTLNRLSGIAGYLNTRAARGTP